MHQITIPSDPDIPGGEIARLNDAALASDSEWLRIDGPAASDAHSGAGSSPAEDADAVARAGTLLVRSRAFESVGGLVEDARLGAIPDLAFRLEQAGWRVDGELDGSSWNPNRRSLRARLRAGAGALWIDRRRRACAVPAPRLKTIGLGPAERAGSIFASNCAPVATPGPEAITIWTDAYPARSETFIYNEVLALRAAGRDVRVVSMARPARIERTVTRDGGIEYVEDVPPAVGLLRAARLSLRHPLRTLGDLRSRSRWAREEDVRPIRAVAPAPGPVGPLHVHFAAGAALGAMRLSRIRGSSFSLIAHGYDVFASPANLAEKLRSARVAIAPCEYTARHLESICGRSVAVIVMGVDPARFSRRTPVPDGRTVVAVGRLVAKKGFGTLIDAAAALGESAPVDSVVIVGTGPLEDELRDRVRRLGLDNVEIVEAWGSDAVRDVLEGAAVVAVPSVIAPDGDRDAMPVVAKEAMAMGIPIVASDVCGLPELVRPDWGVLATPGDAGALARALDGVLALPKETRRSMGDGARRHVAAHFTIEGQAERLLDLIETAGPGGERESQGR